MQRGDLVKLRAYSGEEITRRVVYVKATTVAVCRDDELRLAEAEGREPLVVGFPRSDVIEVVESAGS